MSTTRSPRETFNSFIPENHVDHESNNNSDKWIGLAVDIVKWSVTLGVTAYFSYRCIETLKTMVNSLNQENTDQKDAKKSLAKRLKRPDIVNMTFNTYEARLMTDVLGSEEITVSFADVGGLDEEVEEVFDSIVFPIQLWNHRNQQKSGNPSPKDLEASDDMTVCPTGVLLYGAPGTGKTMIAKAIAKESGATFINIKASSVMDKWFGESDRLVSALFSLARKLGPTIVFIDEIETLLRKRDGSMTNPALTTLQGVVLAEWDGLVAQRKEKSEKGGELPPPPPPISAKNPHPMIEDGLAKVPPVVVLGATNRPGDIDPAFLRRMPVQVRTHMPDTPQRLSILKAMLREEQLSEEVDLGEVAESTEGYSGSDLRELVRLATLQRMKEMKQSFRTKFREAKVKNDLHATSTMNHLLNQHQEQLKRPLTKEDFDFAIDKTLLTVRNTAQFNDEVRQKDQHRRGGGGGDSFAEFAALLSVLSSQTQSK